jgi:hypothetical protein
MQTETIEIDDRYGAEYRGIYVFQEITWAKRSRIIQKHTKYHPVTGQVVNSDFVAVQAETIWASLKKQPENKPITFDKLLSEEDGIPIELGELFSRIANRLCSIAPEEQRFLSEQSEDKNLTQPSQDFDYAKNSVGHPTNSTDNQQKQSKGSS